MVFGWKALHVHTGLSPSPENKPASGLTPQGEQETPITPLQDKDDVAGNEEEEDINMRKMRKRTKPQQA
ncbi:hypothetical protein EYF80_046529 [Liparis tanakae]|uniref:Uncharacterized protein n=1 Tax=Liparis tanakae TaxID=230148 RepID=A0A4Z2FQ51_9TELE|nr:hypothetical protein EYF80_046529 [Liparis tanakae]